jgi:hypothetical protein
LRKHAASFDQSLLQRAGANATGSSLQIPGTFTAAFPGQSHASSSPAIMLLTNPSQYGALLDDKEGASPSASGTATAGSAGGFGGGGGGGAAGLIRSHNRSSASLPLAVISVDTRHPYQPSPQYQQALHPQTSTYLNTMLSNTDPDFHLDPRNYRGLGGIGSSSHHSLRALQLMAGEGSEDMNGGSGAGAGAGNILRTRTSSSVSLAYPLAVAPGADGSLLSSPSERGADELEESIYDYDQEAADLALEPVGDRGFVTADAALSRTLLPEQAMKLGGQTLLELGYVYQHSTNTYVHRGEGNRSKFGQYERSPLGDPLAGDFSDRHIQAIIDTTVGFTAPVIYIPPGAPAAEPGRPTSYAPGNAESGGGGGGSTGSLLRGSTGSAHAGAGAGVRVPGPAPHKPLTALAPGEVVSDSSYGAVRTAMRHPQEVVTNSIHYNNAMQAQQTTKKKLQQLLLDHSRSPVGGAGSGAGGNFSDDGQAEGEGEDRVGHFGGHNHQHQQHQLTSADNSTIHSSVYHGGGDAIQQDINDYIARTSAKYSYHKKQEHQNGHHYLHHHQQQQQQQQQQYGESIYSASTYDASAASLAAAQDEKARVKLWGQLNNRYRGDREGTFNRQQDIKHYVFNGIKEETQVLRDYLAELEDEVV